MTLLLAVWLIQDLTQVLLMGFCMTPDAFLLTALLMALLPGVSKERQTKLVWIAFIGGLVWDLRWTNLPGLTAAVGGGVIGLSSFLWSKTPSQGRSAPLFALTAIGSELLYAAAHAVFWTIPSQTVIRQFLVQQLMAIPVIAVVAWIFHEVSERYG